MLPVGSRELPHLDAGQTASNLSLDDFNSPAGANRIGKPGQWMFLVVAAQ
jgi:hypothetical protein